MITHAACYVASRLQPSASIDPLRVGSPKITASLVNMLELEPESLASLPAQINGQVGI